MSMTAAKQEGDQYPRATALASELREDIADQLHDLVVEREEMGSQGEVVERVQHMVAVVKRISEARGRQAQARELGLPLRPSVSAEREAREMLRAGVMALAGSCGSWVVAMDFEERRQEIEQ